jgi:hypothetical protein
LELLLTSREEESMALREGKGMGRKRARLERDAAARKAINKGGIEAVSLV